MYVRCTSIYARFTSNSSMSGTAMARRGLILDQNEATASTKLYKHIPVPWDNKITRNELTFTQNQKGYVCCIPYCFLWR